MMQKVNINKNKLIQKIRENRESHKKIYDKALYGYKIKVHQELKDLLKSVKDEDKTSFRIETVSPISHIEDYDNILSMLDMETEDTITLSDNEFKQFVLDKWNWSDRFNLSNKGLVGIGVSNPNYDFDTE